MKYIAIFLFLFLTGCTLQPRPYDNVEYSYTVSSIVSSTRAIHRCGDDDRTDFWKYYQELNTSTLLLSEFVNNKSNTGYIADSVNNIRSMVVDISKNTNFTNRYCSHKLSNIQTSNRIVARVIGGSDRFNYCDKGIGVRFAAFKNSYDENAITLSEFNELAKDLLAIEKIDANSCDMHTRDELIKEYNMIKQNLPGLRLLP